MVNRPDVLLVEDSIGDVLLASQILGEMPIQLRVVRDGLQALLVLGDPRFQPAAVILDLNIPYVSGQELLAQYHPQKPPIVVFTSSWNENEKHKALAMGARECVVKPMDLDAYTAALRCIVERWVLSDGPELAMLADEHSEASGSAN